MIIYKKELPPKIEMLIEAIKRQICSLEETDFHMPNKVLVPEYFKEYHGCEVMGLRIIFSFSADKVVVFYD